MMSEPEWNTAARFGIGGAVPPNFANGGGRPPLQHRLFSPTRKANSGGATTTTTTMLYHQHHHHQPPPLLALAPTAGAMMLPAAASAAGNGTAVSCAVVVDSSSADTSHYTTSNSSSSGAQSAVDCKRTRGTATGTIGTVTIVEERRHHQTQGSAGGGGVGAVQSPVVSPSSIVNTTDTTTSDCTSSGFTSGGIEMIGLQPSAAQFMPPPALAHSFSSGCAEVGADGADERSSSISSASSDESSSAPVVIELATNICFPDGQPRKTSLQHHYSPMRMHCGNGAVVSNSGTKSPQKVATSSPEQRAATEQQAIDKQYQKQSSPTMKRTTKVSPAGGAGSGGGGGRLRTALAATDHTVRRVASFTFSPPSNGRRAGSLQHNNGQQLLLSAVVEDDKQYQHQLQQHHHHNNNMAFRLDKRNSVASGGSIGFGNGSDKLQRKMALGPLSKTLHFLRTKLDFSMSASVLCPSREDCRAWQESFDALLAHKYGCLLFRAFLQSEFSEENLEFWLECEQFKRMKPGKKSTTQKANQIFGTFVRELAPKEVNLDSQTRLATQAALTVVPLRADMFMLAQQKIAQLMAKDSYPRFLKSEQYLELLNNNNSNSSSEYDTQQQQQAKGLLRVASAREGSAKSLSAASSGGCSRSPSLSPQMRGGGSGGGSPRGGRWSARRNTCAPVPIQTTTTTSTISSSAHGTGNRDGTGTTSSALGGIGCPPCPAPLTLQIPSIAE